MSDSVDRVFVHALNTVKKIPRTGTARPPPAERLKLYGLYKQSMEGDVEGIMDRPTGDSMEAQAEREKWDAWNSQRGLSRTEAKRRYITTLIDTMHRYASQTSEARELVSELEFVWDQIKSNPSSSSSSSPLQAIKIPIASDYRLQSRYGSIEDRMGQSNHIHNNDDNMGGNTTSVSRLRVLSPVSQSEENDLENSEFNDDSEENFQEARDPDDVEAEQDGDVSNEYSRQKRRRATRDEPDQKWRQRVEQALTKLTAETAAVREQLESRALHRRSRSSIWAWMKWLFWSAMRQILWDMSLLGILLIWFHLKGDPRLENRVRVALGALTARLRSPRLMKRMPRTMPIP